MHGTHWKLGLRCRKQVSHLDVIACCSWNVVADMNVSVCLCEEDKLILVKRKWLGGLNDGRKELEKLIQVGWMLIIRRHRCDRICSNLASVRSELHSFLLNCGPDVSNDVKAMVVGCFDPGSVDLLCKCVTEQLEW